VASQEQYHSARGLVKAFYEEKLDIPAVIRLGGNFEEKAIEILQAYLKDIPGAVEDTAGTTHRSSAPADWKSWWPRAAGSGTRSDRLAILRSRMRLTFLRP